MSSPGAGRVVPSSSSPEGSRSLGMDFHLHTNYSDGTLAPAALVDRLLQNNIQYFALTDHDSLGAYQEVQNHLRDSSELGAKTARYFVGVEINTNEATDTLHVLGYGKKLIESARFLERLAYFRNARIERAKAIVEILREDLKIPIVWEDVAGQFKDSVGRPNIADVLVAKGVVKSRSEAFNRFLLKGKPAYVSPMGPTPQETIELIRSSGGVAVLAHPGVARVDDKKLSSLKAWGLSGIEAYYPTHSPPQIRNFLDLANRLGLLVSLGSDYHGPGSGKEKFYFPEVDGSQFDAFIEAIS